MLEAKLGIAPIAWWNDDLVELSDDVSLDECLRQASVAGYSGMETGRRFPMDMGELGPILDRHGISVCGGWHSGRLLEGDIEAEKARIRPMMDLFIAAGAPCIVYGEIAGAVQGERGAPLATKPRIANDEQMKAYGRTMTAFAEWCADEGMPIAYHHHMGAAIETEAELDGLMSHSGEALRLAYDTGHLAFAGGDGLRVIERHRERLGHIHTKDVRKRVVDGIDRSRESFLDAVIKGAFTVPGDGDLDFETIVGRLHEVGYEGWFVVEAEQDPVPNPPLQMAIKGHAELTRVMTKAGYKVTQ